MPVKEVPQQFGISTATEPPMISDVFYIRAVRTFSKQCSPLPGLAAMLPWLQDEIEEIDQIFPGGDPFPYGIEPNRPTLEALVHYMVEQHFIPRAMPIDELFVPLLGASGT